METTSNEKIQNLIQNIEQVIQGKTQAIKLVLTCLLAKGHVLMEDNPGSGKTVLAKTLAGSISGSGNSVFKRVQFTPDLLPMDLLGTHIFDDGKKEFVFKRGPLFCNVLLADEINRASPKVQSALLESMAEHQITMGEQTYKLEDLFFTIATQNPIEMEGTYPLPAAQLDRFFMKLYLGYVDEQTELTIYKDYVHIQEHVDHIKQVLQLDDILQLQLEAAQVFIHPEIIKSVSNLVRNSREHEGIALGASTRAGIIFIKCLKAYALVQGRTFVLEDDVQAIATSVLDHRLIYKNKEARLHALPSLIKKEMDRLSKLKLISAS
ncbi:MAG: MoxR family ATPase [Chitinophagaceae bacterium]|nr:MoxR family ATPase [Chitinophagaceae bacterium]